MCLPLPESQPLVYGCQEKQPPLLPLAALSVEIQDQLPLWVPAVGPVPCVWLHACEGASKSEL